MQALSTDDTVASINLGRCIGCGLCVPTCPENAILLVNKAQEVVPPVTEEDLFDMILAGKTAQ
jgi:Fe-S-cluster-containing hydrogenase component 2